MIPGLIASQVATALREFIITGFETETPPFAGEFRRLVEEQQKGEAFIKGPYITIGLPFKKGKQTREYFEGFQTEHPPHLHQEIAWKQLTSNNAAKNTLIATGTGSGKTECFLYPLLDHCRRNPGKGIKAVIIYPMNALATDQAKRFAKIIVQQASLHGIRVGLFVGGNDQSPYKVMSPEQVISCKETMRASPPDILLTNYRMLDYLLMRPKDQSLWQFNQPDTLKYLVVDELHTFDGAQGTDLALLIRRLRARLGCLPNHLTCVGTSATLGSQDQAEALVKYASDIFASPFLSDAIIAEQRVSVDEFIGVLEYLNLNPQISVANLKDSHTAGLYPFLDTVYELFFLSPPGTPLDTLDGKTELGRKLRQHGQVQNVLRLQQKRSLTPKEIGVVLKKAMKDTSPEAIDLTIQGLLALLAHARSENGRELVQLRVQLWARELRRIVATLSCQETVGGDESEGFSDRAAPILWYADDKPIDERPLTRLPLVQCRECHGTAWLSRIPEGETDGQRLISDLPSIYTAFFKRHPETAVLVPLVSWPENTTLRGIPVNACRYCGTMTHGTMAPERSYGGSDGPTSRSDCPHCQAGARDQIRLVRADQRRTVTKGGVNHLVHDLDCPYCRASSALVVFGARAASLSAVAIHRLFSSPDNDHKKLITFSDSVQDAAHQAGFFSSRTWHNNIRMAIAQMLQALSENPSLSTVADLFESFWLKRGAEGRGLPLEAYLREFMPPENRYRNDFELFEKTGRAPNPGTMLRLIRDRILWQICEDLSWRSLVGRSLNRVGIAALEWDAAEVGQTAVIWSGEIKDSLGFDITPELAEVFFHGLIQHMIQLGAISLPYMDAYIDSGCKTFLLTRMDFLPGIGPTSPRPRFPATASEQGFEVIGSSHRNSWFHRWLKLHQTELQLMDSHHADQVIESAFGALVKCGLLQTRTTLHGSRTWALSIENLKVARQVVAMPSKNERALHLPLSQASYWVNRPLISATSAIQRYEKAEPVRFSFFRALYQEGEIHRVIAHEHTGLLARDERERIENSFIKGQKPWEFNLLSATPTLEMGIDIGDLSSVLLCSVPPAQANYLQRVGRGGRRDGNSFILTVANGRPHDLVFYADPRRMLDTPVEPPAIFLKAKHVLRRQLLAYAFDCWTRDNRGQNLVPASMQPVLDAVAKSKPGVFPYSLLDYVSAQMQSVWDGFSEHVADSLSDEELTELRSILFGGGQDKLDPLNLYINTRLKLVADERDRISDGITAIKKKIATLTKLPKDEHTDAQLAELEEELEGFKRLRQRLNRKDTLNFFTDEGLLPNYAFPEEGATLHSIIFRTEERPSGTGGAERELVKTEYEYQRPAQAALGELAPQSTFYAGNRKVTVTRVETAKGRNIEDWRFCPRCNYSTTSEALEGGFHAAACPRCHSTMWADTSARTKMLKMTQVYAFTNAREAQLDDGSDDREPEFFNRQMLIDFSPGDIVNTWVMEDESKPFGFEFVRSINFLEVNFGRRESEGERFDVAGMEMTRAGFRICESCGSVQSSRRHAEHLRTCPYHVVQSGSSVQSDEDRLRGIVQCLYLYRQFSSEAMRILLPRLATGGLESQMHSFIAALQLGLKRQFGGKVGHLRVAHQSEPIGSNDDRRHYLVLYDSVPGGTGYIQELLANVGTMKAVFTKAFNVMTACDCYDQTMDGCYRCILEYRNSYGMEQTKKSIALEMLRELIDESVTWVQSSHSLSAVEQEPWIDSELEARFPQAIESFSGKDVVSGNRVRVRKDVINQKNGFRILIGDKLFTMEPHVLLGAAQGVQFQSEADFVIRGDGHFMRPVAIFLDGFEFHRDIVQQDLLKRQALMHAGYVVWSLNWYDVNQVLGDKALSLPLLAMLHASDCNTAAVSAVSKLLGLGSLASWANLANLERLIDYLWHPDEKTAANVAWLFSLSVIPGAHWPDPVIKQQVQEELLGLPVGFTDRLPDPFVAAGHRHWPDNAEGGQLQCLVLAGASALKIAELAQAGVLLSLNTEKNNGALPLMQWQVYWHLVNVLQFLPNFYAYTPGSKVDGIAAGLAWPSRDVELVEPVPAGSLSGVARPGWLNEISEDLASRLEMVAVKFNPPPTVYFELEAESGEIIAEAELAIEDKQVAFLVDEQSAYLSEFEELGWKAFVDLKAFCAAVGIALDGVESA